jgi:hypothetical protein
VRVRQATASLNFGGSEEVVGLPVASAETAPKGEARLLLPVRLPRLPRTPDASGGYTWPQELVSLGDLAEAVQRDTGLAMFCDAFVTSRLPPNLAAAGSGEPAWQLLRRTEKAGHRVVLRGDTLRIRVAAPHRSRLLEPPARLVQDWRTRVAGHVLPSLTELAELASSMSLPRGQMLASCWGWHFPRAPHTMLQTASWFREAIADLRLWGGLTAPQRRAAESPEMLAAGALSEAQRRLLLEALLSFDPALPIGPRTPPPLSALSTPATRVHVKREQRWSQKMLWGTGTITFVPVDPAQSDPAIDFPGGEPIGKPFRRERVTITYWTPGEREPVRSIWFTCAP